jgi:hypothetical protein
MTVNIAPTTLTPAEIMQAAQAGVMRRVFAIRNGVKPGHGYDDANPWQIDIEGALAECAVAKRLGRYWPGKGVIKASDVGGNLQVRSTPYSGGHLIVNPTDPDDEVFIFVTGGNGTYCIRGWMYGRDCKRPEWWRELKSGSGRMAYAVPQEALQSIDSLP